MQVELTPDRRAELDKVNVTINGRVRGVTDQEQYGVPEYWEAAVTAGDCEDYALAKRQALRDLGWPAESMDIAVCRILKTGENHAVLVAHTSGGDYVLDNLRNDVERWDDLRDYDWLMVSVDGSFKQWRKIT